MSRCSYENRNGTYKVDDPPVSNRDTTPRHGPVLHDGRLADQPTKWRRVAGPSSPGGTPLSGSRP